MAAEQKEKAAKANDQDAVYTA